MPFSFTSTGSSGTGTPGKDSLFLGTWDSVTAFLAIYQGGPIGLPTGDWWAFVKDNTNPNKIYVVREDPDSATGWVIDDNEHFVLPAGPSGQYPNYLGEYNNGASYPVGGIVSIPVGSPYGNPGQLFIRSGNPGNPGYPPGTASWTEYTNGLVVAGLPAFLPLKASSGANNYLVPFEHFNYGAYGNTIAIARTPQVDAYMNYAIATGIPQMWYFKHFQSEADATAEVNFNIYIELGVPTLNVEIGGPAKPIWTLSYTASEWNQHQSGWAAAYPQHPNFQSGGGGINGIEYGLFLAKTGALNTII
jgi:hypothetical protein